MSATRITGNFILTGDQVNDLTDEGESTLHYHASDRARANHTGEQALTTLSDMDKQSFTNLIKNGDFESWSAGTTVAPDSYVLTGAGATIAREGAIIKHGTYSAKVIRNGVNAVLYSSINNYEYHKNRVVTVGVWVYATIADRAYIRIADGVGYADSSAHTGDSTWQWLSVSRVINNGATFLRSQVRVVDGDTSAYFSGNILVDGLVCPAFSPKPLVDDAKSITIDSETNKVTFGGLIVFAQIPQILTGAGAVDITSTITHVITSGSGADALTLADGIEGQHKTIIMKTITTGGDTSVLTPDHFANGSTITGNSVGDIQNMIFSNGAWHWTGGRGAIIA